MCDIHERVTLATIMQKDVFEYNLNQGTYDDDCGI